MKHPGSRVGSYDSKKNLRSFFSERCIDCSSIIHDVHKNIEYKYTDLICFVGQNKCDKKMKNIHRVKMDIK